MRHPFIGVSTATPDYVCGPHFSAHSQLPLPRRLLLRIIISHYPNLCPESNEGIFSIFQFFAHFKAIKLSPVSCCSIVETCVLPILLYDVENLFYHPNPFGWLSGDMCSTHPPLRCMLRIGFSSESIQMIDSFQGEIAKTILRLPKWYSNTAAIVALDGILYIPSALRIRKLRFLHSYDKSGKAFVAVLFLQRQMILSWVL